jgi:ribosomal protein S14
VAFHRVMKLHRADLQRFIAEEFLFHLRRQEMRQLAGDIGFRRQAVRRGAAGIAF